MPRRHDDEQLLNGALARLLTDAGIPSEAEQKRGRRKVDVVADVDGVTVMLEAEAGFKKQAQAIKDADARLNQNLSVMTFAVCYPDDARVATLANAELRWTLRTKPGAECSPSDWSQGGLPDLAAAVKHAPANFDDVDGAAKLLSQGLEECAAMLSRNERRGLAQHMNLPLVKLKKGDDGYLTAAKRGLLVVATAMLFHHRVHAHLPSEAPAQWRSDWPPRTAAQCALDSTIAAAEFDRAWQAILAVDYAPVFVTAREALAALPITNQAGLLVLKLAQIVQQVARLVSGMRHDLLGRIFHRVLDTARYDGSYYTSTAAATLLAGLAIREEDCDWSDVDAVAQLKICDPACGTGTLLMAAARRIHDLRDRQGLGDPEDEALLAEALVEDVLWGYDINITATHLAASALGMLSPTTQFRHMNVHIPKFGVEGGVARIGSLELLDGQMVLDFVPGSVRQVEGEEWKSVAEHPGDMDLVIMNPPFTRDSLRYDQFSSREERALKDREQTVLKQHELADAIHLSGSSTSFCVLAEHIAEDRNATIAAILPTASITAPSGLGARKMLGRQFHVDAIISSHDPQRIYMSENTSIGEVLIVCRRWRGDATKPPTRFINLAYNPSNAMEALDLLNRLDDDAQAAFTIQQVPAERIAAGDWNAVNFFSPFLSDAYRSLTHGKFGGGNLVLSAIADVGPEGRAIRGAFTRSTTPTPSGRRALWYHKTPVTQSLRGKTDSYIEPKKRSKPHLVEKYWGQRSRLLLPHKLWLPLARVCAITLDTPTVGSIWTPCRPHDGSDATIEALAVFLNSSIGVLSLLGGRDNRKPSYPSFSIDTLRALSVPNLNSEAVDREALAAAYQQSCDEILLPLPEMNDDPVRRRLDDAVTAALGLDAEWVAEVRRALSEEPSVTNRRFGT